MSKTTWNMLIAALLIIGDLAGFLMALGLTIDTTGIFANPWFWGCILGVGILLAATGHYDPDGTVSRVDETSRLVRSIIILAVGAILGVTIIEGYVSLASQEVIRVAVVFGALIIPFRWGLRSVQKFLFRYKLGACRAVIVGRNARADLLSRQIRSERKLGYDLLGFVADTPQGQARAGESALGGIDTLPALIRDLKVDEVILALDSSDHESILRLMSRINGAPAEIKVLPDMYEAVTGLARTEHIISLPLIRINPLFLTPLQKVLKRSFDVLVAGITLVALSPAILLFGLAILLTSPGPAVFRQERIGLRGRRFTMYKLRSMYLGAEKMTGPVWAREADPRVTPFGGFLRRFHLDEIPQLWNVLVGHMSLVGPRPERPHFVAQLSAEFPYYHRRLGVRPGITGWAQVKGNYDTSLEDVRRKLKDDFFYIENQSFKLDLKILLMTILVVFGGNGH